MSSAKKSTRMLVTLTGAVACSAALIWLWELPRQESRQQQQLVFAEFDEAALQQVTIKNKYGSYTIQRSSNTSQGRRPFELKNFPGAMLSPESLRDLFDGLKNLRRSEPLQEAGDDYAAFGLAPAVTSVEVQLTDVPAPTVIALGNENEFVSQRYFKLGAEPSGDVYLTGEGLYSATDLKEEGFRERRPVRFEAYTLQKIRILKAGSELELQQQDGQWKFTAPKAVAADQDAVSALFVALKNSEVKEFVASKKEPKATTVIFEGYNEKDSPQATFRVELTGSESADGFIGALSYEPQPYVFSGEAFKKLQAAAQALRVQKPLASLEIAALSMLDTQGTVALLREKNGEGKEQWKFGEGLADKKVDEVFVNQWVADITAATVVGYEWEEPAQAFPQDTTRVLRITDQQGKVAELLVGGHTPPKHQFAGWYAKVVGIDEVFVLADEVVKKILPARSVIVAAQ